VVEEGKGLVLIAGRQFLPQAYVTSPLAAALPMRGQRLQSLMRQGNEPAWKWKLTSLGRTQPHLRLSDDAADNDKFWTGLPGTYCVTQTARVKPGTMILAEGVDGSGESLPLITASYWGRGRVVWHSTDSTWRWRLGRDESAFARYWLQTFHFLHGGAGEGLSPIELWTTRSVYASREPATLLAELHSAEDPPHSLRVIVRDEAQMEWMVELMPTSPSSRTFEGQLSDLPTGRYEARLESDDASTEPVACHFEVRSSDPETAQLPPSLTYLQRLANRTGGRCFRFEQVEQMWQNLPRGASVVAAALPPRGIWNSGWSALLLMGLLCGEWLLRWYWGYW
jgi:hypothetical protein